MNRVKAKKHYKELDKNQLINLLLASREEIELLKKEELQLRVIRKLANRVKKAIRYINHYTCKRQYMTENDKELLKILEEGKYKDWYQKFY